MSPPSTGPERDETAIVCASYPGRPDRARQVYGELFRRAFEFVYDNRVPGAIAEFGVYRGFTAMLLADLIVEFGTAQHLYPDAERRPLCLYDSFTGLPATTHAADRESYAVAAGAWGPGTVASPQNTEERVRRELRGRLGEDGWSVVPGFYEDTLTAESLPDEVAVVNLDCDLYESTLVVLDRLLGHGRLPDGALVCFDDWNLNRANNRYGQRRALVEAARRHPQVELEPWLSYGWHGQAFVTHR